MNQFQLTVSNGIAFLASNDASLSQPIQTAVKSKSKRIIYEKFNECKKRRKPFKEEHKICRSCYKSNTIFKPTGNKSIDDFIKYTQCNLVDDLKKMEVVPYDQFKNIAL